MILDIPRNVNMKKKNFRFFENSRPEPPLKSFFYTWIYIIKLNIVFYLQHYSVQLAKKLKPIFSQIETIKMILTRCGKYLCTQLRWELIKLIFLRT